MMRNRTWRYLQSKQWIAAVGTFVLILKISVIADYAILNLLTLQLNIVSNPSVFHMPTYKEEMGSLGNLVDFTPQSLGANVQYRFSQAKGNLAILHGREQDAIRNWQQLPEEMQILSKYSEIARRAGLSEASRQWLILGEQVHPQFGDWAYWQASLLNEIGNSDAALTEARRSLTLPLKETGTSDIYYLLGKIWSQRDGSSARNNARVYYEKAIELNRFQDENQLIEAHFDLAEILRLTGAEENALQNYVWVVEAEPNHYSANLWLGTLYWKIDKDFNNAVFYLERAIELKPEVKWAYRNLARIFQEVGDFQIAIELYQRVIEIDPSDSFVKQQLNLLGGR